MNVLVDVIGQKLNIVAESSKLASGTQEFIKFIFQMTDDWDGLSVFAQFIQNGIAYNQYLDETNSVYLPAEIKAGKCYLILCGSGEQVIATTNYLTLRIDDNHFIADEQSVNISHQMYEQLVTRIDTFVYIVTGGTISGHGDLITRANEASNDANTAVANINAVINNASQSADRANSAQGPANIAADNANEAAANLVTVTNGVITATDEASQALNETNIAIGKVNNAADNATSATNRARTAIAEAESVDISTVPTPTGTDVTVTNREGLQNTVHINTVPAVGTIQDIRNTIRLGLGSQLFPIGYEFIIEDQDTGLQSVWAVRAHNHHTATNLYLTNTMTIEMKCIYGDENSVQKSIQFDSAEALYRAEEGLAAGTYNFSLLSNYDVEYGGGKTISFTITNPIPSGGVIMFPWGFHTQSLDTKISTYASNEATTVIETVPVVESANGTALGTADGLGALNHTHRIRYGSNNYAQSAIRQWLNSNAAAGSVWTPQTKYDRPPNWATTYNGFMHSLPADFLEAVQSASIPLRTNGIIETNSLDGTEFTVNQVYTLNDKFFLLSRPEIYGTWDNATYKDGEQLGFYNGLTNEEIKKYDKDGIARCACLRSPCQSSACDERIVSTDGSEGGMKANDSCGVTIACIIA